MKTLLGLAILFSSSVLWAEGGPPAKMGTGGKYTVGAEIQVGYPFTNIENPDGSKAHYDGLGLRMNMSVPVLDTISTDINLLFGGKYLDLSNTANTNAQYETATVFGPGAGLALRYTDFILGAQYYQLWGRHSATGEFSGRSKYSFGAVDYFAGMTHQFGRLGVSLLYSTSTGTLSKDDTSLTVDSTYNENMVSLQFTFDTGETFWQILSELF